MVLFAHPCLVECPSSLWRSWATIGWAEVSRMSEPKLGARPTLSRQGACPLQAPPWATLGTPGHTSRLGGRGHWGETREA